MRPCVKQCKVPKKGQGKAEKLAQSGKSEIEDNILVDFNII
jgi:hypothetical protein